MEQGLKAKRLQLMQVMESIVNPKGDGSRTESLTADEQAKFDTAETELRSLDGTLERAARLAEAKAKTEKAINKLDVELRSGAGMEVEKTSGLASNEYRSGFLNWMETGRQFETRSMGVANATNGGYLAPQSWNVKMVEVLRNLTDAFGGATLFETETGNDLPIPTFDDTANTGAQSGENTDMTDTVDPTLGQVLLKAWGIDSNALRVSWQLMQDSSELFEGVAQRALTGRLADKIMSLYTTGAGTTTCKGIVTCSTKGVDLPTTTLGSNTQAIYQNLLSMKYSVSAVYRQSPATAWMFSDSVAQALESCVDGETRPSWLGGSWQGERPMTLLGYPVKINPKMASIPASSGTATKSILFGDISQFCIRRVKGIEIMRLNERYANSGQVGFIGWLRTDSNCVYTSAIRHGLHAAS